MICTYADKLIKAPIYWIESLKYYVSVYRIHRHLGSHHLMSYIDVYRWAWSCFLVGCILVGCIRSRGCYGIMLVWFWIYQYIWVKLALKCASLLTAPIFFLKNSPHYKLTLRFTRPQSSELISVFAPLLRTSYPLSSLVFTVTVWNVCIKFLHNTAKVSCKEERLHNVWFGTHISSCWRALRSR